MMVRCGACRTQFEVPGPGRFSCPVCGSVNVVRDQAGAAPSNMADYPAAPGAVAGNTAQPPENVRLPRITCPECDFSFIVGDIAVAICPNCEAEVRTGAEGGEEE
jgi:Zn finger protein HypA/HybF involved in hydrogenase expression